MAYNPERDCSTCIYGDNGPNPEGCSNSCWEPDLPDYDPIPAEHSRIKQLEKRVEALELENDRLRNVCSLVEQRLRFSLDAFHLRPPFRNASVATDPKEPKHPNTNKTHLPLVDARGVFHNILTIHPKAEPSGEALHPPKTTAKAKPSPSVARRLHQPEGSDQDQRTLALEPSSASHISKERG